MRPLARVFCGFVVVVTGLVVAASATQGCQDPTQVTLVLTLDKKAQCSEIPQGTAISIGVAPYDTEQRVASGYVTAKTNACNTLTNDIGTLVVTPTDDNTAAVIIVVGYKGNDPTNCRPPLYKGCIVARRRFAFAEHTRLVMPVSIDPDCADVPCDAFSTCNKGQCYDSATDCSGGNCEKPGELPDGAVDEASVIVPDANGFDSGPPPPPPPPIDGSTPDGSDDGSTPLDASEGGPPDGGPQPTTCSPDNMTLYCSGFDCSGIGVCCNGVCQGACFSPSIRYCCGNGGPNECNPGQHCNRPAASEFGTCVDDTPSTYPTCINQTLYCSGPADTCNGEGNTCCPTAPPSACNSQGPTCPGGAKKHCCSPMDCKMDGTVLCIFLSQPDNGRSGGSSPNGPVPLKGLGTCAQ